VRVRARIHRGAAEIGGNCVELEAGGQRLLLDLGLPLTASPGEVPLPEVAGLQDGDPSLLGVVISHPHPDHYGLLPQINPVVPVFIGEAAEAILNEASFFTGAPALPPASGYLSHLEPFHRGPFRITPYLVDHSAFDSYALLVEGGGRRLFYTGDLRAHGRKPSAFDLLIRRPPEGVHALLLEGTRVGGDQTRELLTEKEVEGLAADRFGKTEGAALALFSPQNVDRLVTVFRAARQAGRELVLDLYAASVARATERPTIPQPGFDGLRVYVPQRQRVLVRRARAFAWVDEISSWRIYPEDLAADPARYVIIFRHSTGEELLTAGVLRGATAVWMMWPGYLESDRGKALKEWLAENGIEMTIAHASGHATLADLKRIAEAVDARRVVPIHTEHPELYDEHFLRVQRQPDGKWWEV
jgi:ribonuclease J